MVKQTRCVTAGLTHCAEAEWMSHKKIKMSWNSLVAIIHKSNRNASGNSEKVVHFWIKSLLLQVLFSQSEITTACWVLTLM